MYKTPTGHNYLYLRSYYLENKEKIQAKSSARYQRCKDTILAQHKERHKIYKRSLNGRYTIAKQMGKRRGHGWDITYEQYVTLIDIPCFYCKGPVEKFGTGLDRINSSLGYVFSNVRPCCKKCNQAKSNLSEFEFYEHILKIAQNIKEKLDARLVR